MPKSTVAAGLALLVLTACSSRPPAQTPPEAAPPAPVSAATAPAPGEAAPAADAAPAGPPEEAGARELQPGEEINGDAADEAGTPEAAAEVVPDAAHLLHEGMDAYESADAFWEQGAIDDAFAALDHAYELMVQVPSNGDPVVAQEKENLRLLVSRRIIEIHASRQSAVGDPGGSIPRVDNADVAREIASFVGAEREFFLESYRRSGQYRPMIVAQLRAAGLPESLSWMPLVESGFKERALSRARALGLWQFIASTGYRYGLDRSDWIDERLDPEKSTQAALAYLTALHNLFGDWLTALAAYNCGEHAVLRQIQYQKTGYFDQFWDLYERLPRETRRYVPRFLAVLAILDDPGRYGVVLPEPLPPIAHETVEISRSTPLEALDRALALPEGSLARLNPELRRNASPAAPYALKVPPGRGADVLARLPNLPSYAPPRDAVAVHRVRSGETLSGIAARYGTSVRHLMALNHLRSANRISPGQRLRVPGGSGSAGSGSSGSTGAVASAAPAASPGGTIQHRVRPGDSLWLLASRYGTTVDRIRRDNRLTSNLLRPGQVLTIQTSRAAG